MTAHVDFTSVRDAAEAAGLETLALLDQTYFVMGLCVQGSQGFPDPQSRQGTEAASLVTALNLVNVKRRLALKTLIMPGGLGSTMKVIIFGKGVGTPALRGCSYRMRVT